MPNAFCLLLFTLAVVGPPEHIALAQTVVTEPSPATRQRVEAMLRSKVDFPPASSLSYTLEGQSEVPGFDRLSAHFKSNLTGTSGDLHLLLSKDGSRLAQFTTLDIAGDPRNRVPSADRPARGGSVDAPVIIVNFDDLECPHCANLHRELFPALTNHYKDQVRIVYQALPSDGHPWAMRAAIDTDCLGKGSSPAYWAAVDTIHQNASTYGGTERQLSVADEQLDAETLKEGEHFHVKENELKACIKQQDMAPEQRSTALATSLGVGSTPTFFVNGAKFEGELPISFVFDMVDNALEAEGKIPPPREDKAKEARSASEPK